MAEDLVQALHRENEALKQRVEALEHLVDSLVQSIGGLTTALPNTWHLSLQEEVVFRLLYSRRRPVPRWELMDGLYGDNGMRPGDKIIDVLICKMRKKLDPYGILIETVWGNGYQLTKDARLLARAAIQEENEHG